MNRKTAILLAIGVGFLWWFTKRTIAAITYSAGSFRVHKITFSELEFRVGMTITNRSDIPASISAFIGNLYYQNPNGVVSDLGFLQLVHPAQLPGFGQVNLEFSLKTGLLGTGFELLKILTNGNPTDISKVDYRNIDPKRFLIVGTLKVGELPVDIKTNLV
jgi:hypothetical protein